jgi:Holliday junction DNA helicase RuvA
MIAHITGTLLAKDLDRIEVMTAGGLGYLVQIPLSVYEALPKVGEPVTLPTALVVKEDGWMLFGFTSPFERRVFELLLTANGVGPALALGLLSSLTATRVVRAITEKDIATLQGVPRVGRKKAERLILDLADKLGALSPHDGAIDGSSTPLAGAAADEAMRALASLGYSAGDAERAVRAALDSAKTKLSTAELIRAALGHVSGRA